MLFWNQIHRYLRVFAVSCFACLVLVLSLCLQAEADEEKMIIVLDPGHGGHDSGAEIDTARECDIVLSIAEYLKEELETYENVKVILTRDEDEFVELAQRTQIAADEGADCLVSLHVNARGPEFPYDYGSTVLAATGNAEPELAQKGQTLASSILYELEKTGLEDQGILTRESQNDTRYDNGNTADYYAIIRQGIERKILSVLIEHAFLDNEKDYQGYLNDEEKLRELAKADARGIARYFSLEQKNGEKPEPIYNRKERILLQTGEHREDISFSEKTFFVDKKRKRIEKAIRRIAKTAFKAVIKR